MREIFEFHRPFSLDFLFQRQRGDPGGAFSYIFWNLVKDNDTSVVINSDDFPEKIFPPIPFSSIFVPIYSFYSSMFSGDFPTRRCLRQFFPIIQFRVTSKLPRPLSLPFPKLSLVGTFLRIHAAVGSLPRMNMDYPLATEGGRNAGIRFFPPSELHRTFASRKHRFTPCYSVRNLYIDVS